MEYKKTNGGIGSNHYSSQQPQTFDQLAATVKNDYFLKNYSELLNMHTRTNDLDAILKSIEDFVKGLGVKVSTSQLRNIFDKVKKETEVSGLKLIRPHLAYIAGRATNDKDKDNVKKFLAFIDSLIKSVDTEDKLEGFKQFFESVVAYHKFYSKAN